MSLDIPSDATVHIGASKPGLRRFNESIVLDMNGFIMS